MATVTAYTAERTAAIEAATIVDARIESDHLILTNFGGDDIDVGNVKGATGATGAAGTNGTNGTNGATGAAGAPGADGDDGADGADGADATYASVATTLAGTVNNEAVTPEAVINAVAETGLLKAQFIANGGTVTGSPGAYALIIELDV